MDTYIAMLRGINVSGQKKIKMADLVSHLNELNFEQVSTYIQSGNIVFKYQSTEKGRLEGMISAKILEKYKFEVPTIVRTPDEFMSVIDKNPFLKQSDKPTDRQYITFLGSQPDEVNIEKLATYDYAPEEFILDGLDIYFYSPKGYGKAKMNNNFFENKLKVAATTRNWKTVNKLLEMASE